MINYVKGDATRPIGDGNKIVTHICNDEGKWGKGFVLAVSRRWRYPERMYRAEKRHKLGDVQFIQVEDDIVVANMVAQHSVGFAGNVPPIRYAALRECLIKVADFCKKSEAIAKTSIHMPRIGCGLAGGKWEEVEAIVNETLANIPVTVYDL
jgi:O-acetyl-ADP-ribose deacetylase (regulator of RNase III)